jgi:hypothetical protein
MLQATSQMVSVPHTRISADFLKYIRVIRETDLHPHAAANMSTIITCPTQPINAGVPSPYALSTEQFSSQC